MATALFKGTSKNSAASSPPGVKSLAVTDLAGQLRQAKSDCSRCPWLQWSSAGSGGYGLTGTAPSRSSMMPRLAQAKGVSSVGGCRSGRFAPAFWLGVVRPGRGC